METTYFIDSKRGVAISQVSGDIKTEDIISVISRLLKDDGFSEGMPALIDMSRARIQFEADSVGRILTSTGEVDKYQQNHKLAAVAADPLTFRVLQHFSSVLEFKKINFELFDNTFDALHWILAK